MLVPLLLVFLGVIVHSARAVDVYTESYFLTPSATPTAYQHFGNSIATQDDVVLVSSPFGGNNGGGIVYEFTNTDGQLTLRNTLTSKSTQKDDQFGVSTQLLGDLAVVGAPYHNAQTGSAYLFQRTENGWTELQELSSRALRNGARFGSKTALSSQRIVVGAPCLDSGASVTYRAWTGLFVVYDLKNGVWTESVSHTPIQAIEGSQCGRNVAISDDLVFVACATDKYETQSNKYSGAVYVYQVSFGGLPTVRELQRLTGSGSPSDHFGASLAAVSSLSQTLLYVGSQGFYESGQGVNSGAVHIFSQENAKHALNSTAPFSLTTLLSPPTTSLPVYQFGSAFQVRGDRLVVGAFASHDAQDDDLAGMGFYYKHDGLQWVLSSQLQKTNPAYLDRLGVAVGLSSSASQRETVLLGADMCNFGANLTGVVAVYNFNQHDAI